MFEKNLDQPTIDWRECDCLQEVPGNLRCSSVQSYLAESHEQEGIQTSVKQYIEDVRKQNLRSLLFYGPPNTAKSHLSVAIYREIVPHLIRRDSGGWCLQDIYNKTQTMQNHFWIRGDQLKDALCPKLDCPGRYTSFHLQTALFGVLDDIDKYPSGNWASALYGLIEDRTAGRLPTVISMNLSPTKFVKKYREYGAPILSRLMRNGTLFVKTC